MTIVLEPREVPAFVRDPEQGVADHFGVLKSQYLDWLATDGQPRCGSRTAKGERCRYHVSGGIRRSLEDWLHEDGGFCAVHGGEARADARRGRGLSRGR